MKPEHHVNDLRETVRRVRELFEQCKGACPPVDAPPEVIAGWEGAFMAFRGVLLEELLPLLDAWEKDEPHWRTTELMLDGKNPKGVIDRVVSG